MGGGKGSDQDVTQRSEPWIGAQPFIKDVLQIGQDQYQSGGPQFFPDATYVPFSPYTEQAINSQVARAGVGNPLVQASQANLVDTASGNFLNSNPYLDATFQQAMRSALPSINATFGMGSRTGSNAHTQAIGQTASDLLTDIYGDNYQQERGRQLQTAALAPAFAANDYQDIQALFNAGGIVEGKANQVLQDRMNRYNYYQNLPEANLDRYAQVVYGNPGINFGTSTTEGIDGNPLTGAVGGGLLGYGAAQQFFPNANPLIGAGLGAAIGLFS